MMHSKYLVVTESQHSKMPLTRRFWYPESRYIPVKGGSRLLWQCGSTGKILGQQLTAIL